MSSLVKFNQLEPALSAECLKTIESFGFTHMTPVQAATIPLFLTNKDVCVEATTGSGKTLAFGIPIFEILTRLRKDGQFHKFDIGGLVLAPTRELAIQIHLVLSKFTEFFATIHCGLFVGGTDVKEHFQGYEEHGIQVMIGTPGRILDVKNKTGEKFNWKKIEILILDEADTLLDLGFKDQLNQIFSMLPKQRRTGLFSATQTKEVKELARAGLRNPVSISVRLQNNNSNNKVESKAQATPTTLDNWYMVAEHEERPSQLARFLCDLYDQLQQQMKSFSKPEGEEAAGEEPHVKVMVFCSSCACVDYYSNAWEQLVKQRCKQLPPDLNVIGFHGKMVHKKRTGLYQKFLNLNKGVSVMFSTDVAARGVDIPDVNWIVQLAAPKDPSFFVHRVGRTARAGKRGGAVIFVAPHEVPYVELLRGRGVPLVEKKKKTLQWQQQQPAAGDASEKAGGTTEDPLLAQMKKLAMKDRKLLEEGSTAFMSFLRAYKENLCSYIFRLDQLDIGGLARSYALLRLPKIPETRGVKGKPIVFETTKIDTSKIAYRNKEQEKARLRKLAEGLAEQEAAERMQAELEAEATLNNNDEGQDGSDADSEEAVDLRTLKSIKSIATSRREKQPQLWLPEEEYRHIDEAKRKRKKKQGVQQKILDEWDELAAEEMAYKKFKKGKMSKADYEECLTSEKMLSVDPLTGEAVVEGGTVKRTKAGADVAGSDSEVESEDEKPAKKVKFTDKKQGRGGSDDSDMSGFDSDMSDDEQNEKDVPKLSRKEKKLMNKHNAPPQPKKVPMPISSGSSVKSFGSFKSGHSAGTKIDYRNRGPRGNLFQRTKGLNKGSSTRKP